MLNGVTKLDQNKPDDAKKENNSLHGKYDASNLLDEPFTIVGIGASAGGLAALELFFSRMPDYEPGINISFVLVQHLSPDYKSILSDLLKQYTKLPVCEIRDGMTMEPYCIHVAPPNREVTIRQGRLYLKEPDQPRVLRLPIDIFFRSLARDQKERSVCIILSGSGTDGTLGLKAIKDEGGMVMVQDPDSAQYKNMPFTAIATDMVDYVLFPKEMPEQLIAYIRYTQKKGPRPPQASAPQNDKLLQEILSLLHAQTGHDFSGYKKSTISRRIERRLAVNQIEHPGDYLRYLHQNIHEIEALFRELLVGVTGFFRDPEAFDALRKKVIPRIFKDKNPGDPVRIWIPGCSTGEEAYSLAIMFKEYLEELKQPYKVQIFATDIDSRAIDRSRQGVYPAGIASDVTPERLKHFFTRETDGHSYKIKQNIRDMLVFSEHNVTSDPPFSRLDLISCRNLLIFLDGDQQKKILYLFHYALNPQSFLFLGTSETIGELADFYASVDRKWKLYTNKETVTFHPAQKFYPLFKTVPQNIVTGKSKANSMREVVEKMLLQHYTPACAAINKRGEILYIHRRTGKYLEPAPGEISLNITHMAREGLKLELTTAIRKAVAEKKAVTFRGLRVKGNGAITTVNLTVSPFPAESSPFSDLFMVIFEEVIFPEENDQRKEVAASVAEAADADETSARDERIIDLERELRHKEEYLQTVIEELETSNEELQSTNEEFQSANEELETSKEELQSLNEELITVNTELQKKIEELYRINNDINNMLLGTGMGTIFVDHQLLIQRFTPPATRAINLIQSDLGRPVNHIVSNLLNYDLLEQDVQTVLNTLMPKEVEVRTKNDGWYLVRILPYRTIDNVIEGAVINFIDITELKHMQEMSHLAVVVRDSNDAVTMQDLEGKILAWNPGAEKLYGWRESEALGMNISEIVPEERSGEALEMVKRLAQSKKLEPFQTQRLTKNGEKVEVWITATMLVDKEGKQYAVATTERLIC